MKNTKEAKRKRRGNGILLAMDILKRLSDQGYALVYVDQTTKKRTGGPALHLAAVELQGKLKLPKKEIRNLVDGAVNLLLRALTEPKPMPPPHSSPA